MSGGEGHGGFVLGSVLGVSGDDALGDAQPFFEEELAAIDAIRGSLVTCGESLSQLGLDLLTSFPMALDATHDDDLAGVIDVCSASLRRAAAHIGETITELS